MVATARLSPRQVASCLLRWIPYVTAGLIAACGVALVCGVMALSFGGGAHVRVTLGVVFILYGTLRVLQIRLKARRLRTEREEGDEGGL